MKKKLFPALCVALFAAFGLLWVRPLSANVPGAATPPLDAGVSVIMYAEGNDDRWKSLEEGIRQACRDVNIESPVVSVPAAPGFDAQASLLDREAEGGARGLLVAAAQSREMAAYMESLPPAPPMVFLKNGPPDVPCVRADGAGMARLLAEHINAQGGAVLLLTGDPSLRDSHQERAQAFAQALEAKGIPYTQAVLYGDAGGAWPPLPAGMVALACLDTQTLEHVLTAASEAPLPAPLYGIGGSDTAIHALNQGILTGLVFQNEYAIGYIAMMRLCRDMGVRMDAVPDAVLDAPIQYMYVDRDNMFSPEAERLLFPIAQ